MGWASLVGQTIKNLPTMQETQVRSLGQEDPLEKGMATHSSVLAWRIPWIEEPGGMQSMGSQRVGQDWATNNQWSGSSRGTGFHLFRVVSLVPRTVLGTEMLLINICWMHACFPGTVPTSAHALSHRILKSLWVCPHWALEPMSADKEVAPCPLHHPRLFFYQDLGVRSPQDRSTRPHRLWNSQGWVSGASTLAAVNGSTWCQHLHASLSVKVFGGTGQSQLPEPSFQKLATKQRGKSQLSKSKLEGLCCLLTLGRTISRQWYGRK